MNHGSDQGGWQSWLPMILCCAVMLGVIALFLLGVWTWR